jgi:hypothetical protein
MKKSTIHIQIPEPCHEDWNKMTATKKGKFCQVCTKEVIDFTAKSDEEIIKLLSNQENTCGRFYPSQLNRKLIADRKKRNHWLSYATSLLLPALVFSQGKPAVKFGKTQTNYTSLQISSLDRAAKTTATDSITIYGVVNDEQGLPLPGAIIKIKGSLKQKSTDFDGLFSIKVHNDDILLISFPAFKSQEIKVATIKGKLKVHLQYDEEVAEDLKIAIVGGMTRIAGAVSTVNAEDIQTIATGKSLLLLVKLKLASIINGKLIKKILCTGSPSLNGSEIKINEEKNKAALKKLQKQKLQNPKKKINK